MKRLFSRARTARKTFLGVVITSILILYVSSVCADEIDDIIPFVIQVESSGNPNAVSKDGCVGLMQISPIVFAEWKLASPFKRLRGIRPEYWVIDDETIKEKFPEMFAEKNYDLFEPKINIIIGTWYLRRLRGHYLKDILPLVWIGKCGADGTYGICKTQDGFPYPTKEEIKIDNEKYSIHSLQDIKLALILAAYNCGPTYLKKVNYDINKCPKETRDYVRRIMRLYQENKKCR